MLTCLFCRRTHPKGTIICTGCGRSLLPKRHTSTLQQIAPKKEPSGEPAPASGLLRRRTPIGAVQMTILNSNRIRVFRTDKTIMIGRTDVQRSFYPDLDLTPDGGTSAGVSRSHARIVFERGQCRIEDLGSANGTLLNGRRLPANTPKTVQSGDEIKLGAIVIRIDLREDPPAPVQLINK